MPYTKNQLNWRSTQGKATKMGIVGGPEFSFIIANFWYGNFCNHFKYTDRCVAQEVSRRNVWNTCRHHHLITLTGPLWGDSIVMRWIPPHFPEMRSFDVPCDVSLKKLLKTRQIGGIWLKLDSNHRFFSLCDLEIWWMTSKNNMALTLCYVKLCAWFQIYRWIQTVIVIVQKF